MAVAAFRELSPLSPRMVTRWRGEGAEPASSRNLKPLGSAFAGFYGRRGPGRKPSLVSNPTGRAVAVAGHERDKFGGQAHGVLRTQSNLSAAL